MATFFRQFLEEENKKKVSKSVKKSCSLRITGAGVVEQKLTFSNKVSELLNAAPPAPRRLFHYITVTSYAAGLWCTVIVRADRESVSRSHRYTVKQSQRRGTSPTVIEACLLTTRSKTFGKHLKCSLTAPRRAGTSSGIFLLFLLKQPSVWVWETWYSALSGPASRLASAMTFRSEAVIPRRRSTAVHFQSVARTVQRNLEELANVRLDELTVVRRHWLFFF